MTVKPSRGQLTQSCSVTVAEGGGGAPGTPPVPIGRVSLIQSHFLFGPMARSARLHSLSYSTETTLMPQSIAGNQTGVGSGCQISPLSSWTVLVPQPSSSSSQKLNEMEHKSLFFSPAQKLTFISFQKQSALFPLSQHSQRPGLK